MAVTLKQVAQAAGVSTAAACKALHGRGESVRVSPERAQLIRETAERLNYRPNVLARNLRSQRTNTVGLIFENFGSFGAGPMYYSHLLDGIGSVLFHHHYRLTLLPEIPAADMLGSLGDGQLDGVVWCKLARDARTLETIHQCPIPIVALNAPPTQAEAGAIVIGCDNAGGIRLAVEHLRELGHREIAFAYEVQEATAPDCQERLDGFRTAMGDGFRPENILVFDWNFTDFAQTIRSRPEITAVVAWSERAAGRILQCASEAGIRIPEDLSVVGFDSTAYCESTKPRLTSVRQPIFEMAQRATTTLLDLISGHRPEHSSLIFPCGFDPRDSTAPPRASMP